MDRLGALVSVILLTVLGRSTARADISPESGSFLFHNYSAKEYGASPQNWAIAEDSRGVMYFGNTNGVLEFDGVYWRPIPLGNNPGARSLAVDSRGTVFVGGDGTFGYLAPDVNGAMQFVSLLDRVPKADRTFGSVWDVLPTSEGVYFLSKRRLFFFSGSGPVKSWQPTQRFGRAFTAYEELFVTTPDRGLLRMVNGELVPNPISDLKVLSGNPVFAFGEHPMLANARGLFHFSLGLVEAFTTAAASYFAQHDIYALGQLPTGEILVGTTNGGVVLLNGKGEVERVLTKKSGLPSDSVTAFYRDRKGGIWIATDAGLTRFEASLSGFGETQALSGSISAVNRVGGALYVGTSSGLFRLRQSPGGEAAFDPVSGLSESVFVIADHAGTALVGARRGLYSVSGLQAKKLFATDVVWDIGFSAHDPQTLYLAGRDGVQMLRQKAGEWTMAAKEGHGQEFRSVVEDPDGRVWATTRLDISRFDFRLPSPAVEQFDAANGVPANWKNVYLIHGHPVFTSQKGLLHFSEAARRFVPDPEFGSQFSDGTKAVSTIEEDASGNIWLAGTGYNSVLRHGASGYQPYLQPLLQTGIDEMWAFHADPDGTAWASGDAGLLYRAEVPRSLPAPDFHVLLRSALVTGRKQMIFGGDGPGVARPRLPYSDNALRFEFAAPSPEGQAAVQYQVKLEGGDKQWSPWTTETRKDYTNLPERAYVFRVRARDAHNNISPEAAFPFAIQAPWYRTWWAYAGYVVVFLFAGWLILRWRLRALEAKNKWLENVVEERTAEVRSERDQNEALLLNILPKPIATELRTTGLVKPTAFDDVTVCFSDFVGFTLSSEKLPPEELISSLNEYFTAFDEIIGRYGLEKLKTIGDAYMFASGLPTRSRAHAVDAVLAALEMVAASRRLARPDKGVDWRIRLGLYSGPVVAGVVGKRKFAFDIWGNTVNFAARMESSGAPDRVNLSKTTCSLVSDFIECEPRGRVRIKEGREMEMFFAVKPKSELMGGTFVNGVPKAFSTRYQEVYAMPPKSFPDLAVFGESLVESQSM